MQFRRSMTDELQQVWDGLHEVQEVSNDTARHLDDFYANEVHALQNFRTDAEAREGRREEGSEDVLSRVKDSGCWASLHK